MRRIPRPVMRRPSVHRKMRFGIESGTGRGTLGTTCSECFRSIDRYISDVIAAKGEITCGHCGKGARFVDFEFEKYLGPGDRTD